MPPLTTEALNAYLTGGGDGPPTLWAAYLIGVLGSLAIELAAALKLSTSMGGTCPPIYKQPFYILARLSFAFIAAGTLPVMMQAQSHWSAFYLGATAPIVFDRLAKGLQPD